MSTPHKPTWVRDIAPMIGKRARAEKWDGPATALASFRGVIRRKEELLSYLRAPIENVLATGIFPHDFSEWECKMFTAWLSEPEPPFMDIDDREDLLKALQLAIEVELATLPPYLTAMYSIEDKTSAVYQVFHNIVVEEMAHFGLACNILVSIGGIPDVTSPDVVPEYPTELPGGLRPGLKVHLRKFSVDEQLPTFMSIEQPVIARTPKKDTNGNFFVDASCDEVKSENTIGYMYDQIKKALTNLVNSQKVQFGNADQQVTRKGLGGIGVTPILTLDDATTAIDHIVEQGEGGLPGKETGLDPIDDTTEGLAHFYAFAELFYGKKLVVQKGIGFSYSGDPIGVQPDGIYNMMDDPNISKLTPGSDAYVSASNFIDAYVTLLTILELSWTDDPNHMGQAISDMFTLADAGVVGMKQDDGLNDGFTVGTPFQLKQ